PLALTYLVWCGLRGNGALLHATPAVSALLVGSGLVTAVPLFLFAYGARALPYSTVGVLQYIGPSLQLLCGVLLFHESFGTALALGFALIWAALLIYAADGLWRARTTARAAASAAGGGGSRGGGGRATALRAGSICPGRWRCGMAYPSLLKAAPAP